MPVCRNCQQTFPIRLVIDGKERNFGTRRYCLDCSPFGNRNTRRLHLAKVPQRCLACGRATENSTYCSNRCQRDFAWNELKKSIDRSGVTPAEPRCAKRYVIEQRGLRCEVCRGTEWMGRPMPLVLDHVNGDAADWRVGNLRLVCGNCDMQLPTYKSRNRGKGRAWRRGRYAEGKSY